MKGHDDQGMGDLLPANEVRGIGQRDQDDLSFLGRIKVGLKPFVDVASSLPRAQAATIFPILRRQVCPITWI